MMKHGESLHELNPAPSRVFVLWMTLVFPTLLILFAFSLPAGKGRFISPSERQDTERHPPKGVSVG